MTFLALAASLAAMPARASSTSTLRGVDVYGTSRFSAEDLESRFGEDILKLARDRTRVEPSKPRAKAAEELQEGLERSILKAWGLPWVRLRWTDQFDGDERGSYLMVDVVEEGDLKARLPFRPAPATAMEDPLGLLAAWHEYSELGWRLARGGLIKLDRAVCPAFHCQWGSQTPELKRLEDRFVKEVPKKKELFEAVLAQDKDPSHRVAAAYLLSYIKNGNELSNILKAALKDPELEVRAAAMRVYNDLAIYHRDLHLPVENLAEVLDYPTLEDRNKALAVMVGLADHPRYQQFLLQQVTPAALRLLRLKNPANRDLAYTLLGLLSKMDYPPGDYDAWEGWVQKARAAKKGKVPR